MLTQYSSNNFFSFEVQCNNDGKNIAQKAFVIDDGNKFIELYVYVYVYTERWNEKLPEMRSKVMQEERGELKLHLIRIFSLCPVSI